MTTDAYFSRGDSSVQHVPADVKDNHSVNVGDLYDLMFNPPAWRRAAKCLQSDPDLHFPAKGESPRDAKRICAQCGVRPDCLAYALEHRERFGVYGGIAERDRRRMLICDRDEFRRILSINELELQRLLHPDRPADMSGLWFGVCSEGHEVVDGNAYLWGWASSGRPRVTCRRCALARDAKAAA